jgi:hypothetical protein
MMKLKPKVVITIIFLFSLAAPYSISAEIMSPEKGEIIENRSSFPVVVEIPNFDSNGNYWMAIASVKNYASTKDRVLSILNSTTGQDEEARKELVRIIANWQINQFWPKFVVKRRSDWGDVYDGGRNPRREPQPMILLLIKVSDTLDQRFDNWLTDCEEGKGCNGIPGVLLKENMIVSRTEIFFP